MKFTLIRLVAITTILFSFGAINACGQKGPLYLPEDNKEQTNTKEEAKAETQIKAKAQKSTDCGCNKK